MINSATRPVDPEDRDAWKTWSDAQLKPMDLTTDLLHAVVEAGQRKHAEASPLAPPATPGQDRWSESVIVLRERTGWKADDSLGLPRTVHPSGRFYIIVRTGSNGVGAFSSLCPTPKHDLGDVIKNVIDGIPPPTPLIDIFGNVVETDSDEESELWILLTTFHNGMIYSELSRPTARKGGTITKYSTRIQLPPLPFNDVDPKEWEPADTPTLPDSTRIEIDVRPRQ